MTRVLEHDAGGAVAFGLDDLVLSGPLGATVSQTGAGGVGGAWTTEKVYFDKVQATQGYWQSIREAGWLEELEDRFKVLGALSHGWDGHYAPPVDVNILVECQHWLRRLSRYVPLRPSVVPTREGGLALEWHRPGLDVEIELSPEGQYYVSYEDDQGNDFDGPLAAHVEAVARALAEIR